MNCSHCKKALPENCSENICPDCKKSFLPQHLKFNARLFFSALLLPPLITLISAAFFRYVLVVQANQDNTSFLIALIGGGMGGVICGVTLGRKVGKNLPLQIMLSILFAVIFVVVCIMLCCFGCNLGGYQLRFG